MQLPESATGTVVNDQEHRTTTTSHITRHKVTNSDPYLIERIVGYQEYGRALNYFDRLVDKCDEAEMLAIEEIVRSEPEFAFYTVADDQPESYSNDSGQKRHGFRWITALARVETGAMRAGFSENRTPFPKTPGYDIEEYRALLDESARLHFWSLTRDPMFAALMNKFQPSSLTLSYMRRLNIATGFSLAAGIASVNEDLRQGAEISNYTQRLNLARSAIQTQIAAYLAMPEVRATSRTVTSTRQRLVELCNAGVCREFDAP